MEIRDSRDKDWFWLDNEYLNGYAKHLGIACTVVYLSLCRHSNNKTQTCYPSMKLIAEENGISTRTVVRATAKLQEWGIIDIQKEKKSDGTQANNVYTLTSKKTWKPKPSDTESHGKKEQKTPQPSDKNDISRVTPGIHNKTNINYTNNTIVADATTVVFSYKDELEKLRLSNNKIHNIVGLYFKNKSYYFDNKAKFISALKRAVKPASDLLGYSGEELGKAMHYCIANYPVWTLETVVKRIADLSTVRRM